MTRIVVRVVGALLAFGGGKVWQAETLLALGQPFSPNGGAPVQAFLTNPRAVAEIIRSESALQEAARAGNLRVGQLVGNAWLFSACGDCQYCNTGWETLCEKQQNGGYSVDGSFGQYMLVDARFAAIIPEGADPVEVAPVLCAGVTVYKGLKMTEAKPGEWKMAFRAGKPATDAARTFAQKWLSDLQAQGVK